MSDDFIPLNQSTPTGNRWQGQGGTQNRSRHNLFQNRGSRGHNRRFGNNSQGNSSFGSDSNSSCSKNTSNIDAYLHPSMLHDPWMQLRKQLEEKNN